MFAVIHIWPNGSKPTIMPDLFERYDDARKFAEIYQRAELTPGHAYHAVTMPPEILEFWGEYCCVTAKGGR